MVSFFASSRSGCAYLLTGLFFKAALAFPVPQPAPGFGDFLDKVEAVVTGDSEAAPPWLPLVSSSDIARLTTFANYARAAYCSAGAVLAWNCGPACSANPATTVSFAWGNDAQVPGFFIGFDSSSRSVIVAHQGTNSGNLISIANNVDILLETPSDDLINGASAAGIQVHSGFLETFERTAGDVLASVQDIIDKTGSTVVKITGHSLGGAIAVLDALHLRSKLSTKITIETVVFGNPRVGNRAFANFIESNDINFIHVHNKRDPTSLVPLDTLGLDYRHASGEVFINEQDTVVQCPGQENEACSGAVSLSKALLNTADHSGPYFGVPIGSDFCSI